MDMNLPQLDTLVKTLIAHDERMAQMLQQIVHQFAAVVATVGNQKGPAADDHVPEIVTPEGQQYLRDNLDVARNPDFFDRPYLHYSKHGKAEGRSWPSTGQTFPASASGATVSTAAEWPKVVTHMGASIRLAAPVHELWVPPLSAQIFGSNGSFVSDPSNAPPGMPTRSPLGFPLVYPGLHWDAAKQEWAGTPIGPVRYHCGESTYDTEAQALTEARAAAVRRGTPPDPGWQDVYDRMAAHQRDPVQLELPLEPPAPQLPPGETPL